MPAAGLARGSGLSAAPFKSKAHDCSLTARAPRGVPAHVPSTSADDEIVVDGPARLDTFVLRSCPALSRRVAHRLIVDGLVRVNGRVAPKGARLVAGDRVVVPPMRLEPEPDLAV